MHRTRSDVKCDVCGEAPQPNEQGKLSCACPGKPWSYERPVAGATEDRVLLEHYGWQLVDHAQGPYWVGPLAHAILYLYDGNTWEGENAPKRFLDLTDYLKWYDEGVRGAQGL